MCGTRGASVVEEGDDEPVNDVPHSADEPAAAASITKMRKRERLTRRAELELLVIRTGYSGQ